MCYFQKWDVSTTEIAHPLWQVSIWIWTLACSFKQNVQGMPARNGEVFVVVVQWHLLWKSVGETPAWCKTACDWTRFSFCSRPIGSLLFFPSVFIPPFQPATCVFHAHHYESGRAHWTALIIDCGQTQFIHTSRCHTFALWNAHCGVIMSHEDSIRLS